MKRSREEDDSGNIHLVQECGLRGNKLSRTEVEKIISDRVQHAVELSDHKMKDLMERIGEVKNEPRYDAEIKKLEAHVLKIKRRGDAVFTYIRKLRSLGGFQSQSLSSTHGQPLRFISGAEPTIGFMSRGSVNSGCASDNTSAGKDCEVAALRRPRKGFWQSLQSKKQLFDLTEDDRAGKPCIESPDTQSSDQKVDVSEQSKPSSKPLSPVKEESPCVTEEDGSSLLLKVEDWRLKLHPFPETPFPKELPLAAATHNLPQKPVVKLARIGSAKEIGIAWNVDVKDPHVAEMDCYYIHVASEQKNGTFAEWKCLGVIKAMPLPMACKVSDCKGDKRLCFIVVGKDIFGRFGPYSDIHSVGPGRT